MTDKCEICGGIGTYDIYSVNGGYRYSIPCPECHGDGLSEEASKAAYERAAQQRRYEATMEEQQAQRTRKAAGATR